MLRFIINPAPDQVCLFVFLLHFSSMPLRYLPQRTKAKIRSRHQAAPLSPSPLIPLFFVVAVRLIQNFDPYIKQSNLCFWLCLLNTNHICFLS
mmetsp:Transcript_1047/g.2183  ORF Transcript_1047/g.2183 Transcript_1047/m.2183 type:complete len:93 (-) Transcript_1047:1039-1317(-)